MYKERIYEKQAIEDSQILYFLYIASVSNHKKLPHKLSKIEIRFSEPNRRKEAERSSGKEKHENYGTYRN